MTKQEARDFLRANDCCPTHGTKLHTRDEHRAYGKWKGARTIKYCRACEQDAASRQANAEEAIERQVNEARKVLGIGGS
jgi:hypothetical protein